jgi:hypothetical protein
LLKTPEALEQVSEEQIDDFGSAGYNSLNDKHPLWGRISDSAVAGLSGAKVRNICPEQLRFLQNPEAIQSLPRGKLVHLKKAQLVHRRDSFVAYVLGVFTLGVFASLVSLVGYMVFPCALLGGLKAAKRYHAMLWPNIKRFSHLFTEYVPAYQMRRKQMIGSGLQNPNPSP